MSLFLNSFKDAAKKDIAAVESKLSNVISTVEKVVIYTVDDTLNNIKSEIDKLEKLVESKSLEILDKTKQSKLLQDAITVLNIDITKAKDLITKIGTAIN